MRLRVHIQGHPGCGGKAGLALELTLAGRSLRWVIYEPPPDSQTLIIQTAQPYTPMRPCSHKPEVRAINQTLISSPPFLSFSQAPITFSRSHLGWF